MGHDWATEWPPARIAAVAHADEARYVPPDKVDIELPTGVRVTMARTIVEVGGHFLVELHEEPDDWLMGDRTPDGVIRCWGWYGELEVALRGL